MIERYDKYVQDSLYPIRVSPTYMELLLILFLSHIGETYISSMRIDPEVEIQYKDEMIDTCCLLSSIYSDEIWTFPDSWL